MNNLTQNQIDAKQTDLDNKQEQMLAAYEKANTNERNAIIGHIDSFFENGSQAEKAFWLKFRLLLETVAQKPSSLFSLGEIFVTAGAQRALNNSNQMPNEFLEMHQMGNWGIIESEDWEENDLSVEKEFRIFSVYKTLKSIEIYVITEADRSSTKILLPSEY